MPGIPDTVMHSTFSYSMTIKATVVPREAIVSGHFLNMFQGMGRERETERLHKHMGEAAL